MSTLYVANCSKSEHLLTYMLPENLRPFLHKIPGGTQIKIEGSKQDLDHIIKQHQPYGFCDVKQYKKKCGPICFKWDAPIPADFITHGIKLTVEAQTDQAQTAREASAAAADSLISKTSQEAGIKQVGGIEVEVIEEKQGPADNADKLEQTLAVVHEGSEPRRRGRPPKAP